MAVRCLVKKTMYFIARVLLAVGGIGAVSSLIAIGVTYLAAPQHTRAAADVFYWSGYTLCIAAVLLYLSRRIGSPDG